VVHIHRARTIDAHGLRLHDQPHEIEEVTALLHHRATRIVREPVPVAHLLEKRKAVLPDGEHLQPADLACMHIVDEARGGWHVAILHPDPEDALVMTGAFPDVTHVVQRRCQGLLAQHMLAGLQDVAEDLRMREVRRRDQHRVNRRVSQHRMPVGIDLDLVAQPVSEKGLRQLYGLRRGIGDPGDFGIRHELQVVDVLVAHHAGPNQSVSDLAHVCPPLVGPCLWATL
jgi:hypothetical protein